MEGVIANGRVPGKDNKRKNRKTLTFMGEVFTDQWDDERATAIAKLTKYEESVIRK